MTYISVNRCSAWARICLVRSSRVKVISRGPSLRLQADEVGPYTPKGVALAIF